MLPGDADQVTAPLFVLVKSAENCIVPGEVMVALAGLTVTTIAPAAGVVTVT
jgi:hypothetical protein